MKEEARTNICKFILEQAGSSFEQATMTLSVERTTNVSEMNNSIKNGNDVIQKF